VGERLSIVLVCERCGSRNYRTTKKRQASERLQMKKFCPRCATHTVHRESK